MFDINHPEHDELSYAIIGAAMRVRSKKRPYLLEASYHGFLCYELTRTGFNIQSQPLLPARYDGVVVKAGYRPDIIVNDQIIVEVKAVEKLLLVHRSQVITYLEESGLRTGLLLNFNAVPFKKGIRRISI